MSNGASNSEIYFPLDPEDPDYGGAKSTIEREVGYIAKLRKSREAKGDGGTQGNCPPSDSDLKIIKTTLVGLALSGGAIREARSSGLAVFGITVDSKAREYFPYLFGRGAFAIVGRIGKLPAALPTLYHHITR